MTLAQTATAPDLLEAVIAGLSAQPKSLPCRFFYDRQGSILFEEICELPEYYVTRTEDEILRCSAAGLAARIPAEVELVELGSGSSRKTRRLIEALLSRQRALRYVPIDISEAMLRETSATLQQRYPRLSVSPLPLEYSEALRRLPETRRGPMLLLFLGSNLGNFQPVEALRFLRSIRSAMEPEDHLLLGLDLQKDPAVLNAAYDDAAGVTARFNLNILRRLQRELGAELDLTGFRHRAFYHQPAGRVEMHLVSQRDQEICVAGRVFPLAADETIHTENSHKYTLPQIRELAREAGFRLVECRRDERDYFSVNLLAPEPSHR
jgi:dimethylhistidine N-methyltransferase